MIRPYRVPVNPRVPYDPHEYPLPAPRPHDDLAALLMHAVAGSDLTVGERAYLLFVLARIDRVTWSGVFEFHQMSAILCLPRNVMLFVQEELKRKGLVTYEKHGEPRPWPITVHLAAIAALQPWSGSNLVTEVLQKAYYGNGRRKPQQASAGGQP